MVSEADMAARAETARSIAASRACQAACEASMGRLSAEGLAPMSEPVRLLRQCAELCALHALALQRGSRLARRTALLCGELCAQVARAAWLEAGEPARELAQVALQACRAARPLTQR
ncbi:hypothetical protein FGE12_06615 [Aggregicoccus sp. 17bor-14]|nr:hypothetical protein [Simulacricoccus sp. 17bor-14]MRI87839.1 hypothetical protein [Aggregicoccus sp. 17bor-14]